jgi:anti-sigma B factor antagonist
MVDLRDDDDLCWSVEVEEPAPHTLLVKVRGDLDDATLTHLSSTLDEEFAEAQYARVVLDLTHVTQLPPPAVEALRHLRRRCRADGGHLVVVGTGHPAVHRPLRVSGLLPLLDTRPTVQSVLMGRSDRPRRFDLPDVPVPR